MGQAVQDLRDMLALARRLREAAAGHPHDRIYHQLLAAAVDIEARAQFLASGQEPPSLDEQLEAKLHSPVNLII